MEKHKIIDYIEELLQVPLFKGIKNEEMRNVLGCIGAFAKEYKKDEFIFLSDDNIKSVGIVLHGSVQMIREDLWGNKAILVSAGEGELFGETFACGNYVNEEVAFQAKEKTTAVFLPFDRVMHSCANSCMFHHQLIENMVKLIANKNVQLMEKIDIVSKASLREKISTYLTIQGKKNHSMKFQIPMGRVQLAEYLNADRSALTRELNNMKKEGLLDFERNSFEILKNLY